MYCGKMYVRHLFSYGGLDSNEAVRVLIILSFCFSLCQHLSRLAVLLAELNVIFALTLLVNQRVTGSIFQLLRYKSEFLFSEHSFSRCQF